MKQCNKCNVTKPLDDFYFRLSKDKTTKYHHAACKRCQCKRKVKRRLVSHICFRCNNTFLAHKTAKYCSTKCMYEGISDRCKFKNELGIGTNPWYYGLTY